MLNKIDRNTETEKETEKGTSQCVFGVGWFEDQQGGCDNWFSDSSLEAFLPFGRNGTISSILAHVTQGPIDGNYIKTK